MAAAASKQNGAKGHPCCSMSIKLHPRYLPGEVYHSSIVKYSHACAVDVTAHPAICTVMLYVPDPYTVDGKVLLLPSTLLVSPICSCSLGVLKRTFQPLVSVLFSAMQLERNGLAHFIVPVCFYIRYHNMVGGPEKPRVCKRSEISNMCRLYNKAW